MGLFFYGLLPNPHRHYFSQVVYYTSPNFALKEFNEIIMIIRKFIYMTGIIVTSVALLSGCGNERREEQDKLRNEGIVYLESQQYEKAIEAFQGALDASLGTVGELELDICYYKAEAEALKGDTEAALATYTAILDYSKEPKAYFLRGNLYYYLEKEAEALADYEAAIKLEKKDYELYIGVFEALSDHGKVIEAKTYLEKALDIKGDTAYDKMQKGRIHFLLGRVKILQAMTSAVPTPMNKEEAFAPALENLKAAAEGKEMMAYYYLAEVYLELEDNEAAVSSMNAYTNSGIADSYKLYEVAEAQMNKANYDMAISCLEAAGKLDEVPNKQIVTRTLVIAYEKAGNYIAARDVLRGYVKDYPEDEEAARELTFLETR